MHEKGNKNNENLKCDMEKERPALPAVDMEDLATFLTPVAQQTVMVIPVRQQELQSSRRERGRSLRRARSYSRP